MPTEPLPSEIDARKFAARSATLQATVPVASLPRAREMLADHSGDVAVELQFSIDERGIKMVHGHIEAEVNVACQRCLKPMPIAVNSRFVLGIVWTDEDARQLPRDIEPLVLAEDYIDPASIVEEELILSIPFVNYHPPGDCPVTAKDLQFGEEHQAEPERDNPFNVLGQLKSDKN